MATVVVLPTTAPSSHASASGPGRDAAGIRTLHVTPWHDRTTEGSGFDARSAYVERFWLPVVGPSCVWLLRLIADRLDAAPGGFDVDAAELARSLGLGGPGSHQAPLWRAVRRCSRFGLVQLSGADAVAAGRLLPPVPQRLVLRLPVTHQLEHRRWDPAPVGSREARRRARLLALDLVILGEGRAGIERRLLRWGVHPALAYEAAGWGASRPAFDP